MERILGLKWSRRALGRCTPCPCSVTRTAAQGQACLRGKALRNPPTTKTRTKATVCWPLPPRHLSTIDSSVTVYYFPKYFFIGWK
jgi:hypothetical protein